MIKNAMIWILRACLSSAFILMLSSCALNHGNGDRFSPEIWTSGNDPTYKYIGIYDGSELYVVTPSHGDNFTNSGVLVKNKIVVRSLSKEELNDIQVSIAQEKYRSKIAAQKEKDRQNQIALDRIKEEKRKIDIDLVAQVLNYSNGLPDRGSEIYTWTATNSQQCIYKKLKINEGVYTDTLNLNDMDPRYVKVLTVNRTSTDTEPIRDRNNWYRIVAYNNIVNNYQTQDVEYDGKTIFSSRELDPERLRRGWTMIFTNYCRGSKKPF